VDDAGLVEIPYLSVVIGTIFELVADPGGLIELFYVGKGGHFVDGI
jgi:hypothetical protein